MPWSKKQERTARAVAHGWKPKGEAKGFTQSFALQVLNESGKTKTHKGTRKHGKYMLDKD